MAPIRTDTPLADYRAKRRAGRTPEPDGIVVDRPGGRTIFVIQEHHARTLHWDLRLERDGVLVSWAVPKGIPNDPSVNHLATRTEDHPVAYADFEGAIPVGEYGAGTMSIWDRGEVEVITWTADEIVFVLDGTRAQGRFALVETDGADWLLHRMDSAPDGWEPLPRRFAPMLASNRDLPTDTSGWAFEPKWDGMRALCAVEGGRARLLSRNGRDLTADFPELHSFGASFGATQALVDGEIIAFDADGRPDFGSLQPRMHLANGANARRLAAAHPVTLVMFDLLQFDGHSLRGLPYDTRRELLVGLDLRGPHWTTSPAWTDTAVGVVLDATGALGLEGIVAKERSSRYESGIRSASWRKVKHHAGQEVVVGGWTGGRGNRAGELGALLVGVYDGSDLVYAGRVGTGFDRIERARLLDVVAPLEREVKPFAGRVRVDGEVHWVDPELVVEVEFTEWTADGHLRHPSYRGTRTDKPADEVTRER